MDLVVNLSETAADFHLQLLVADADLWFEGEGRTGFVFQTSGCEEPVRIEIFLRRQSVAQPGCLQASAMRHPNSKKKSAYG
jgi:hypothetical protein